MSTPTPGQLIGIGIAGAFIAGGAVVVIHKGVKYAIKKWPFFDSPEKMLTRIADKRPSEAEWERYLTAFRRIEDRSVAKTLIRKEMVERRLGSPGLERLTQFLEDLDKSTLYAAGDGYPVIQLENVGSQPEEVPAGNEQSTQPQRHSTVNVDPAAQQVAEDPITSSHRLPEPPGAIWTPLYARIDRNPSTSNTATIPGSRSAASPFFNPSQNQRTPPPPTTTTTRGPPGDEDFRASSLSLDRESFRSAQEFLTPTTSSREADSSSPGNPSLENRVTSPRRNPGQSTSRTSDPRSQSMNSAARTISRRDSEFQGSSDARSGLSSSSTGAGSTRSGSTVSSYSQNDRPSGSGPVPGSGGEVVSGERRNSDRHGGSRTTTSTDPRRYQHPLYDPNLGQRSRSGRGGRG